MEELHDLVSKRVGRVLRKIREEQGLTRAQLSEKSTVSERQISAIELISLFGAVFTRRTNGRH